MRALLIAAAGAVLGGFIACSSAAPRERIEAPASRPSRPSTEAPPPPSDEEDVAVALPPPGPTGSGGNHGIRVFDEAKKEAARIYAAAGQRTDLYCGCPFTPLPGHGMRVDLAACGYVAAREPARAERIEWEHAVPAAAFGHTFVEWRDGDAKCVDSKGKRFHGRKCARTASAEFARIEADLHNLFPVVGEVNGLRGDLPMGLAATGAGASGASGASGGTFHFGACQSAIEHGAFMPRREVRGDLARAYKYMDKSYPERGLIDDAHRPIFDKWDAEDPPDAWERERNKRIAARQGNANPFVTD